jgi:hypothetical protein
MKYLIIPLFHLIPLGLTVMSCQRDSMEFIDPSRTKETVTEFKDRFSSLTFAGLGSISNITDSTATLSWEPHSDAFHYEIYRVQGENTSLMKTIEAPASSFTLTSLEKGSTYR